MKRLVYVLVAVVAFGLVSIAVATPTTPPEGSVPAKVPAEETETPSTAEPLEDSLLIETSSCSPSCSSLRGDACTEGTFVRCYHTCFEPEICTCPDGTWVC